MSYQTTITKKPGQSPKSEAFWPESGEIPYLNIKDTVKGNIEAVYLGNVFEPGHALKKVILWVNEEGKLLGLPPNFHMDLVGLINGPVMFTSSKGELTVGLSDTEIEAVEAFLDSVKVCQI